MKETLNKIIKELEDIQNKEPSSYFTDAHNDGYFHGISDAISIIKFELDK